METFFAINLGRELGSGGREIGYRLAEDLGITHYDAELAKLASEASGLGQEFFERADEKTAPTLLGGLLGARFPFLTESAYPYNSCLSNDALFKIQSDLIQRLASERSCLFVGRCADYVLRDHPRCANIFVTAPREYRKEQLMRRNNLSASDAEDLIRKSDSERAEFYNYYSFRRWGKASTYHLCIDSSIFGIEGTKDFIKEFVKKKLSL